MAASLLEVEGVRRSFGAVSAVDDVSLSIERGTVYGLIGPNGAGKTTLVNMISGHDRPDAGSVRLDGREIAGRAVHAVAAQGVARTFQNIRLFRELPVLDNVVIGTHLHRRSDVLATLLRGRRDAKPGAELLARVGLDPARYAQRLAGTLSYGDQRRLEIARALAQRPRILILDEPTAGMNASEKDQLWPLLKSLVDEGLTLVLIEHDMRLVMAVCQRIAVLNFGHRIAEGTPGEVSEDPEVVTAYLGTRTTGQPSASASSHEPAGRATPKGGLLLEVKDLHVHYGAVQAVRGVSFEVRTGQIVALIGANGAGKSTILRCLSGLIPAADGQATFDGADLLAERSPAIVRAGLIQVPEGREILARQTVRENLELGAWPRREKRAVDTEIDDYLQRFPQLGERADLSAGQLSGGEQQLLAIVRALVAKPKLLLLDEPSLGLAPQTAEGLFHLIQGINADGVSVLLVEQNAYRALELADHAWVIETGTVALAGRGSELLEDERVRATYLGLGAEAAPRHAPAPSGEGTG